MRLPVPPLRQQKALKYKNGGDTRIRTGDGGFAVLCLATWLCRLGKWSGRRDLNPRPSPWQGDALPLSYSRMILFSWWRDPESNWGHADFQSAALPTELSRQNNKVAEPTGFEPAISGLTGRHVYQATPRLHRAHDQYTQKPWKSQPRATQTKFLCPVIFLPGPLGFLFLLGGIINQTLQLNAQVHVMNVDIFRHFQLGCG